MALLTGISFFTTVVLLVIGPVQGLSHLLLVLIRRLRKRPTRFRWTVIVPLLTVAMAALGIAALILLNGMAIGNGVTKALVVVVYVMITASFAAPIWYLLQVYNLTRGRFHVGSYAVALLSLLAMPMTASLVNVFVVAAGDFVGSRQTHFEFDVDSHRYAVHPPSSSGCGNFLTALNNSTVPAFQSKSDQQVNDAVSFWFDQTLSGAFFDGAEVFDCHLSNMSNNPNDLGFSALIVLYRLFAEFILVTIVIWPFVPLVRRIRARRAAAEA